MNRFKLGSIDPSAEGLLETLTLFQTKTCDFLYPISDLTQNLIPYFTPNLTLFCLHKHLRRASNFQRLTDHTSQEKNIDKKVASSSSSTPIPDHLIRPDQIPYPHSFRPKWSKFIPYLKPKWLKNHTIWCCSYPHNFNI